MANLEILLGRVRWKVGSPSDSILGDQVLLDAIFETVDKLTVPLVLSRAQWFGPRFPLDVSPGQEFYSVPVGDFGKPRLVLTSSTNIEHGTRIVDVVDEPDLIMYHGGGDPGPAIIHAAQAIAPVYKDGQWFLRIAPIPRLSASYVVIYEPQQSRPGSFGDTAFILQQFDNLLTDKAALKVLPYAANDDQKYARIEKRLMAEVADTEFWFNRYRRASHQPNVTRTLSYGANRRTRRYW
jgi:hypothetical protein